VMDHFIKLYKKKKGKDIRGNNRAVQKLRREVEKAKRALSSQHQSRIEIESFFEGEDFSETLTRAKFEELNMVIIITFLSCHAIMTTQLLLIIRLYVEYDNTGCSMFELFTSDPFYLCDYDSVLSYIV